MNRLERAIKGRVVGVLAHGASLNELEKRIETLKDYDICWVSMNQWNIVEDFILSKINKKLEILSDCATVPLWATYETGIRIPRFERFLSRGNNVMLTSELVKNDCFRRCGHENMLAQYAPQMITIDSIFGEHREYPHLFDPPPNSITLLFAGMVYGKAKKIIVFGLDGFRGEGDSVLSYYKPDMVREEKIQAHGTCASSLIGDTIDFDRRFKDIFELYQTAFNHKVDIVNCSPNSTINCIRKISYNELEKEL